MLILKDKPDYVTTSLILAPFINLLVNQQHIHVVLPDPNKCDCKVD